jgi:hypothetical protein
MGNETNDQSASHNDGDKSKKSGAFSLSATPLVGEPEPLDVHKFEVASRPTAAPANVAPAYEDLGPLPASYLEDTLFLVARDPRWLFAYWDFDWTKYPSAAMRGSHAQFFLKITKADGAQETIVEVTPEARNWYVPVSAPDTLYFAELGFFARDGGWASIISSGAAQTPPDSLAEDAAADFATVPAHLSFERMLDLVKQEMESGEGLLEAVSRITGEGRKIAFRGGQAPTWTDEQRALLASLLGHSLIDRMGLGSAELDQLLRKQLLEKLHSESASGFAAELGAIFQPGVSSLYSGIGASWSAQPFSVKRERGFYMHVNAEIIFYGGTHPDATVWVDGQEIKLAPDGSFRYHFTLPDGDFAIPIVARSPDGVEQRSATLAFERATEKKGGVEDTGQPPYLTPLIGKK